MSAEKIRTFIEGLADDEIASAIALGKQTLQLRFDERRKALESDYKRLLKDAETGRALKATREEKNSAAAA